MRKSEFRRLLYEAFNTYQTNVFTLILSLSEARVVFSENLRTWSLSPPEIKFLSLLFPQFFLCLFSHCPSSFLLQSIEARTHVTRSLFYSMLNRTDKHYLYQFKQEVYK
jgi:hypothetical protein